MKHFNYFFYIKLTLNLPTSQAAALVQVRILVSCLDLKSDHLMTV